MSSKYFTARKSLALATVSASMAMVACDFSADTTVKASDDPIVTPAPEGVFFQVPTVEDLPNCSPSREGKTAYVNVSNSIYVCSNERWSKANVVLNSSASESSSSIIGPWPESSSSGIVPPPPPPYYGDCFETWKGYQGDYRINTGFDNGSETSGYWFSFSDEVDGGKSTIIWPVAPGNEYDDVAMDPIIDACGGLCGTVVLNQAYLDYNPYVGVGFNLGGLDEAGFGLPTPVDAYKMGGIRIAYMSEVNMSLELSLGDKMDAALGYDNPSVALPKSSTTTIKEFPWGSFMQAGWGPAKISGEEAASMLTTIRIKIQGKDGTTGAFNIISIGALDESCSGMVPPPPMPKSSSSSYNPPLSSSYNPWPISSSSYNPPYNDFETWYGTDGIARIYTGYDAGEDMSGYWYAFGDEADGGLSKITWPVPLGNEYDDLAMDPVVDYCGGVCGSFDLDRGELEYDPFVGVAFDLAGPETSWNGPAVSVDATSMGGVCISYSVSAAATLEMGLDDAVEAAVGYDVPFANLAKTSTGTTKFISWDKFAQAGWGKSKISGEDAAKVLKSLRFKIQGKTGTAGDFNIMSVGPYDGYCSVGYYVAAVPNVISVKK